MGMKKLLSGIIFLMIATFGLNAANERGLSYSGAYMSTFIGTSFAPGYGINTGLSVGYQFSWGARLEGAGSFRKMGYAEAAQVSVYALYDILRYEILFGTVGFGGGCAFYGDFVVPTAGCRAGIGWNVFDDVFSVSLEYVGDIFWYAGRSVPIYINGCIVSFKLLF